MGLPKAKEGLKAVYSKRNIKKNNNAIKNKDKRYKCKWKQIVKNKLIAKIKIIKSNRGKKFRNLYIQKIKNKISLSLNKK